MQKIKHVVYIYISFSVRFACDSMELGGLVRANFEFIAIHHQVHFKERFGS